MKYKSFLPSLSSSIYVIGLFVFSFPCCLATLSLFMYVMIWMNVMLKWKWMAIAPRVVGDWKSAEPGGGMRRCCRRWMMNGPANRRGCRTLVALAVCLGECLSVGIDVDVDVDVDVNVNVEPAVEEARGMNGANCCSGARAHQPRLCSFIRKLIR